jgi:hypothetical protein
MTTAYPLAWPMGWARTANPQRSRFNVTPDQARQELECEIERMGARYPLVSTNIPLRRDGKPYAGAKPDGNDAGVAVYFERNGKQMVFACDRWDRVQDNMRAIQKTIDAMRGIERWGASDMMERAFSAFQALPPPKSPWETLGVVPGAGMDAVEAAYRAKAKQVHPDRGGSNAAMAELTAARDAALR